MRANQFSHVLVEAGSADSDYTLRVHRAISEVDIEHRVKETITDLEKMLNDFFCFAKKSYYYITVKAFCWPDEDKKQKPIPRWYEQSFYCERRRKDDVEITELHAPNATYRGFGSPFAFATFVLARAKEIKERSKKALA